MTALIIIGSILLLFSLLLLSPIRFYLSFKDEFKLDIGYLFLRLHILPAKEKPEKSKKSSEEGKEKKGGRIKEMLNQHGFGGFLTALFEIVKMLTETSKKLLSRIKLKHFDLYMCVGGEEDAAEAAIKYGQISAGVYSACGAIFSLMPCRNKHVTVDIDYKQPENTVDFKAKISVLPIFVIKEALSLLIRAFPTIKKLLPAKQQNAK